MAGEKGEEKESKTLKKLRKVLSRFNLKKPDENSDKPEAAPTPAATPAAPQPEVVIVVQGNESASGHKQKRLHQQSSQPNAQHQKHPSVFTRWGRPWSRFRHKRRRSWRRRHGHPASDPNDDTTSDFTSTPVIGFQDETKSTHGAASKSQLQSQLQPAGGDTKTPMTVVGTASQPLQGEAADGISPAGGGEDQSLSRRISNSMRALKTRVKSFRSMKTFIGRKMDTNALRARLRARELARSEESSSTSSLKQGDDIFPARNPGKSKEGGSVHSNAQLPATATAVSQGSKESLENNNNNGGNIFDSNGRPFWQQIGKMKPDDGENVEDDLRMDEAMYESILEGKMKLSDMPTTPQLLDAYGDIAKMEARDNLFFTRALIFSNTMRSISVNDDSIYEKNVTRTPITRTCDFTEPVYIARYYPEDVLKVTHEKIKKKKRFF